MATKFTGIRETLNKDVIARRLRVERPSLPAIDWTAMDDSDHFVQFFEDDKFLIEAVSGFVGSAIGGGDGAIVIATPEHRQEIARQVSENGIDMAAVTKHGQYVAVDAAKTLASIVVDGMPDEARFTKVIGDLVTRAGCGRRKVRAFGEMVALLAAERNGEAVKRLEELWNQLATRLSVSLFCAYPMDAFSDASSDALFAHICKEHSRVIPAESYMPGIRTVDEQLRSIASLQQKAVALEAEVTERKKLEATLREQTRTLEILHRVACKLVGERDLDAITLGVTEAGKDLSGAAFGAFLYNVADDGGESYQLRTISGAPREAFEGFSQLRDTQVFASIFEGRGIVRRADVLADPPCGHNPHFAMAKGHLPVRSYLAVPVVASHGTVLGALLLGHPDPGVFTEQSEDPLTMLAAQAAVAIDNSNLSADLQRELVATKQAQRQSGRLAAIVESSDDAIISKTLDGVITSWNDAAQSLFGYKPDEVIGKSVTILIPPDHLDEEPTIIDRIRRGQRIDHYETVRRRKDGTLVEVSLTVSPMRDGDGKVFGASKIIRDISERKRNERALEEATSELAKSRNELEVRVEERTKALREAVAQMEEFSYTVSHDLRAPLRAMRTYSTALLEDFGGLVAEEPEAKRYIERIAINSVQLDRMISDVLAFGRVARDQVVLHPVRLDELVRDLVQQDSSLHPPRTDLRIDPLDDVIGHEPSLRQVISNLLSNAVKFVKPGEIPRVHVWTEKRGCDVQLWIEDEGIGIDPRYQHRLFSMFERIHPNLNYEGTGVGLAIVRKAAERMGGQVGIESDGKQGSRFWVQLPGAGDCS